MSQAASILSALGGEANVLDVEACSTRLHVEVQDVHVVDEAALRAAGASGVVRQSDGVQVVVGSHAEAIAADIEDLR